MDLTKMSKHRAVTVVVPSQLVVVVEMTVGLASVLHVKNVLREKIGRLVMIVQRVMIAPPVLLVKPHQTTVLLDDPQVAIAVPSRKVEKRAVSVVIREHLGLLRSSRTSRPGKKRSVALQSEHRPKITLAAQKIAVVATEAVAHLVDANRSDSLFESVRVCSKQHAPDHPARFNSRGVFLRRPHSRDQMAIKFLRLTRGRQARCSQFLACRPRVKHG
jgi:hypothetical protein